MTEATTQQGAGFADEVAAEVRDRSRSVDARLERGAWRLLRRRSRTDARRGRACMTGPTPRVALTLAVDGTGSAFAGLVTRVVAFFLDARYQRGRVGRCARRGGVGLSLFDPSHDVEVVSQRPGVIAIGWAIGYFMFFWSTIRAVRRETEE